MGYWNKIRIDFPDVFEKMIKAEEYVGASAIKNKFLKDLKPTEGRDKKPIAPNCGLFCQIEFEDIMSDKVSLILKK